MAEENNDTRTYEQRAEPAPDLKKLGSTLVGTWQMSGDVRGEVTYEWMKGSFFLIQRVDLLQEDGQMITGLEIISYEKPFGAEPSEQIKSRFYSNAGDTIDYVYELVGDTLTIWAGERGSPAFYRGTFGKDGSTLTAPGSTLGKAATRPPLPESAKRCQDRRRPLSGRGRRRGKMKKMGSQKDLGAIARSIIDSNFYMTLGTADGDGRPWVSPVYYAPEGYAEFYWVSSPEAIHSHNIAARQQVSIVIFDSTAPIGSGQGVYVRAVAQELTGADLERGIDIFSGRSVSHGADEWSPEDVRPPARHRLYRATASEHSVLGPQDQRITVNV
jgi:hypothetical protein